MAEQKRTNPKKAGEEDKTGKPPASPTDAQAKAKRKKVKEDVDKLLDDIDEILEDNAEEFVKSYVQRGGE